MDIQPYPHVEFNTIDNSIYQAVDTQSLPLFRPLVILPTQKGPINVPIWVSQLAEAEHVFGKETFSRLSTTYYQPESEYLRQIFLNSGAFVVRTVPNANDDTAGATSAALVLEAHVLAADLPVYETDENGQRILATDTGEPIDTGETVEGIEITWTVRNMSATETVDDFSSGYSETVVSGDTYKTYVMGVFYTSNPGEWGNNTGFAFYYNHNMNDSDQVERIGGPMYTLAPVQQVDGVTGVIRDVFNTVSNRFIVKPNITDEATAAPVSFDNVMAMAYQDGRLPYSVKIIHENWDAIGDLYIAKAVDYISWTFEATAAEYTTDSATAEGASEIVLAEEDISDIEVGMAVDDSVDGIQLGTIVSEVDTETNTVTISRPIVTLAGTGGITTGTTIIIDTPTNAQIDNDYEDGYEINILGGIDCTIDNSVRRHYTFMNVLESNTTLLAELNGGDDTYSLMRPLPDINNFLVGGSDGEFIAGGKEAKISGLLNGTLTNPDGTYANLEDASRYPFNVLFDVGYTLDTKEDLIAFQAIRGDVVTVCGSYIDGETDDKINNISTGFHLRNYGASILESSQHGTQGCRTLVFAQSGHVAGDTSNRIYSTSLWLAYVLARYHNVGYIKGQPAGLPNSAVEMFDSFNWVPSAEETKRRLWNDGLNYLQYYNMTGVHFPALRSVYTYDTSVLSDANYVMALVYCKQVLRPIWHEFVGKNTSFDVRAAAIKKRSERALSSMLANKYVSTVTVYRTVEETNLGYVTHIRVGLRSGGQDRVHIFDIVAERENYNTESEG